MKKGQIQIIFTWVFILILAGVILFYGIKTIKKTQDLGNEAVIINFFQDFNDKIQLYYSLDTGSSGIEEFKLNNKINYVCFTKNDNFGSMPSDVDEIYLNNLIPFDNVFIMPPVYENNRANINNLDIQQNPTCIEASGGLLRIQLRTTVGGVDVGTA